MDVSWKGRLSIRHTPPTPSMRLPDTSNFLLMSGKTFLERQFVFTASISSRSGRRKKAMLRKKYHVVRKKNHVVRKLFYVASIFGGAAGRKNRPPWELSSTPWELSSTAGDFSSTASRRRQRLQCVYRAPVFYRGAHTSLPDTNNFYQMLMWCLSRDYGCAS